MSTRPHQPHNEELLGLLREVEGVEDRVLFKHVATGRGLSPWPGTLSARSTSISSLEKHLLATHREELGRLLTDACLRIFLEGPIMGAVTFPNHVNGKPLTPMPASEWHQHCEETRQICPDPPGLEDPMDVLNRLIERSGTGPNLLDIAQAGLLIASSDALRTYVAHGLWLTGDPLGAEESLGVLHRTAMNPANRPVAATALARLAQARGDFAGALEWHRVAASAPDPDFFGVLGWLFSSVQAGDLQASNQAAIILATQFEGMGKVIDIFCTRKRAELLAKSWQPTSEATKLKLSTNDSHVQKILNLFH